jgi:Proprotein convertase P-domain
MLPFCFVALSPFVYVLLTKSISSISSFSTLTVQQHRRDVQGIIAQTARPNYDSFDTTDDRNAGNFWHSHYAGFGILQCFDAVVTAETWNKWPDEIYIGLFSDEQLKIAIPDYVENSESSDDDENAIHVSLWYNPPVPVPLFTETVYVWLELNHTSRGHLEMILTSPEETESRLTPGDRADSVQLPDGFYFRTTTRRHCKYLDIGYRI